MARILKKSKQDWPECKFDKPTSNENLELKGTRQVAAKEATSYQISEKGEKTASDDNASAEEVWRLNLSRYSKWYRVKTKGERVVFSSSDSVGAPIFLQIVVNQLNKERGVN